MDNINRTSSSHSKKIELCYKSQFTKKMLRTKTLSEVYNLPIIKVNIIEPDKNIICFETLIGKKYYVSIYEYTEKIEEHFWNKFKLTIIAHRLTSSRKYVCYNEVTILPRSSKEDRIFTTYVEANTRQVAVISYANKFYKNRNVKYHISFFRDK